MQGLYVRSQNRRNFKLISLYETFQILNTLSHVFLKVLTKQWYLIVRYQIVNH